MNKVHLSAVPEGEQRSPTGKFHSFFRNLSLSLGGIRNTGTWGGGHPFDVQLRRLPAGASVCPYHLHAGQWEFFIVHAGTGSVRTAEGRTPVRAGDVFFHPPCVPHQLSADAGSALEVLILTDNPLVDSCHYPDSAKWSLRPPGKLFRMTEVDYYGGEDDPPPGTPPQGIPPPTLSAPIAPFAQRKINLHDLPWQPFASPKGKFRAESKELSIALGALRNTPPGLGGHPFDVEYVKLAPGDCPCPYHWHGTQWEMFYLLSGTATVRSPEGTFTVGSGDILLHPPGSAHRITNTGTEDVLLYLITDNPPADYWYYPDSDKWGVNFPKKFFFRTTDVGYWEGEE